MSLKHLLVAALLVAPMLQSCKVEAKPKETTKEKKEISIQLYSIRDLIGKEDFNGLLKKLAEMGYTSIEAANYDNEKGTFYGLTPEAFKKAVEDAGLKVLSSHTGHGLSDAELASGDFSESMKWWDKCIADHKAAGMKYIVTAAMGVPKTVKELDIYCKYYNEIGKRCKENGMKYGYHNHSHEFAKVEDKVVMYDYMIENTDPELVFYEMDVYWIVRGQHSPVDYFKKYPGRFKLFHVKDDREIGQSGMVGFDAIFNNAETAGVENLVVEVESYSIPVIESVKESLDYLLNAPFVKASYQK